MVNRLIFRADAMIFKIDSLLRGDEEVLDALFKAVVSALSNYWSSSVSGNGTLLCSTSSR
jgi:hypothetical protein